MLQKNLSGDKVYIEERHKKHRKWLRCPECDRKVFAGGQHQCEKVMRTVTFSELIVRR